MRLLAFTVIIATTVVGCDQRRDDEAVLNAALVYFSKELDQDSYWNRGILLMHSKTLAWRNEESAHRADDSLESCILPQELYEALPREERPVSTVLSESEQWRFLREDEEAKVPYLPPSEFDGVPVRAAVSITRPGFSGSRDVALVVLVFNKSVDTAVARVRMERRNGEWQGACGHFNFYPF